MCSFEDTENEEGSFHQNVLQTSQEMIRTSKNTNSNSTISAIKGLRSAPQGLRMMNKRTLIDEGEHVQADISVSPPSQTVGASSYFLEKSQGLRMMGKQSSVPDKEHVRADRPIYPSSNHVMHSSQTFGSAKIPEKTHGLRMMAKQPSVHDKEHVRVDIPIYCSNEHVIQSSQTVGSSNIPEKTQGLRMMAKPSSVHVKEHVGVDIPNYPSTEHVIQSSQTVGSEISEKTQGLRTTTKQHVRADVPMYPSTNHVMHSSQTIGCSNIPERTQGLRMMAKPSSVHVKEHVRADIPIYRSTEHVTQSSQTVGSSGLPRKVHKGRGSNKCKEVASLQVGEKLKVTFYNNRTVGKNNRIFSRHLGKIVRDRNMCPLAVSSWDDIKQEKLNHMWAAITDKFESDDMDIHRDHIFAWMKELWNKYRGSLHGKYVKDRPIQEALRNYPRGVDKRQWEWLIKEHFSTEKFQGGKDGNPPNFADIFYETRKMNDALVEFKTIEKHAQIQELMQSEPSLPTIEVVEKCFGPQTCSHVFGFGGGLKPKDLKGGTTSKSKLWSELCSAREENKSLKDRLSNIEIKLNEMKQIKAWVLSQQSKSHHPTSERPAAECSGE